MAQSQSDQLNEIAKRLRILSCICEGITSQSNLIVKDYQPVDCNSDPVGSPLDVMPVLNIGSLDTRLCNYEQLATAIGEAVAIGGTEYDLLATAYTGPDDSQTEFFALNSIDTNNLHSFSISIIGTTGTVAFTDLDGSMSLLNLPPALPVGFSTSFTASTVFGLGDFTVTTTGDATLIVSCMLSA